MDKIEVAEELVKIAKDLVSADTPTFEYKRQMSAILKNMNEIKVNLKRIKKEYDKQQKEEPDSWVGIGRGSELAELVDRTGELVSLMKAIK